MIKKSQFLSYITLAVNRYVKYGGFSSCTVFVLRHCPLICLCTAWLFAEQQGLQRH